MATITLGKRPESFKRLVTVKLLDGSEGTIEPVFKYRTSVEFGQLNDELSAAARAEVAQLQGEDSKPDAVLSLSDVLKRKREKNGAYLMKILLGWNLDSEFNEASAQQLCDEYPGAADAIFEVYRVATIEGRLGN